MTFECLSIQKLDIKIYVHIHVQITWICVLNCSLYHNTVPLITQTYGILSHCSTESSPQKDPLVASSSGDSPRLQTSGDIISFYQGIGYLDA